MFVFFSPTVLLSPFVSVTFCGIGTHFASRSNVSLSICYLSLLSFPLLSFPSDIKPHLLSIIFFLHSYFVNFSTIILGISSVLSKTSLRSNKNQHLLLFFPILFHLFLLAFTPLGKCPSLTSTPNRLLPSYKPLFYLILPSALYLLLPPI